MTFNNYTPEQFFESGFQEFLDRCNFKKKGSTSQDFENFYTKWGRFPSEDLIKCKSICSSYNGSLFDWNFGTSLESIPDLNKNIIEESILISQLSDSKHDPLLELLSGTIEVGKSDSGLWHYGIYDGGEEDLKSHNIYHFDFYKNSFSSPVFDSLSSFIWFSSLFYYHFDEEKINYHEFETHFKHLEGKVNLDYLRDLLSSDSDVVLKNQFIPTAQNSRFYYLRSLWIFSLLKNDYDGSLTSVKNLFHEGFNEPLTVGLHEGRLGMLSKIVPIAIYALFREFFFDHEKTLLEYLEVAQQSNSKAIRDCGILVEELYQGRKELGNIKNIQALKREFLKLQLDPDTPEGLKKFYALDGEPGAY